MPDSPAEYVIAAILSCTGDYDVLWYCNRYTRIMAAWVLDQAYALLALESEVQRTK